jgi:hypothetical protein
MTSTQSPAPASSIHRRARMTATEIRALPATVDVATAARALGFGRSLAYELARRGQFPCRVLRAGNRYLIPTAELLRLLGLDPASPPRHTEPVGSKP